MAKKATTTTTTPTAWVQQCATCGLVMTGPQAGRTLMLLPDASHGYCSRCMTAALGRIATRRATTTKGEATR